MKNKTTYLWLALLVVVSLVVLIWWPVRSWIRTVELDHLDAKARDSLNVYTGDLQIELDKFEALPYILARNQFFLQALTQPDDIEMLQRVNVELERVNRLAETSAIYIQDRGGVCLAASNWNEEISFIGENLGFRPYFKQALQGKTGRYFALGIMSKVRGYYFSAPIYREAEVIGVLTVKMLLQRLEENWAKGFEKVVVSGPTGVIFISSYGPWRFRALVPLSGKDIEALHKSLRYGDITPDVLGTGPVFVDKHGLHFIHLRAGAIPKKSGAVDRSSGRLYLVRSQEMPDAGWTVQLLTDISNVDGQVRNIVLLLAFLPVILFLGIALLYNRRRARAKEEYLEVQSRKSLQKLNEQLEHRVRERTRELTSINKDLTREVEERRKTERELRALQAELIQAGKLAAIGQMATSIAHETSQPLAAIRMFAENSLVLLDDQEFEEVRVNLQDIADLVVKMSRITGHLKSFARKSDAGLAEVSLALSVSNVLVLLNMEIKKTGTVLSCSVDEHLLVLADQVRLEQVLLNILSNALDAVANQDEKVISITAMQQDTEVKLSVSDSGNGIDDDLHEHIFEPFFTRKQTGKGLGLGLSLSQSIVNAFGGRIEVESTSGQGAVFHIILKRYCRSTEGGE